MFDVAPLLRLAGDHHGVVSADELSTLDVTPAVRDRLLRRGLIERFGRFAFRAVGSVETVEQRVVAACHDTKGAATRSTAAWLHGLPGFDPPAGNPEVVCLESCCQYRSKVASESSSSWLTEKAIVVIRGIQVLCIEWVLFSLAGEIPGPKDRRTTEAIRLQKRRIFHRAVEDALRLGLTTEAKLWAHLEDIRCRGRKGVTEFELLLQERADAPTESWLEREFLAVLDRFGLPRPDCQERIEIDGAFVARVDFRYRGTDIVIEVTGHRYHSSVEQMERDQARRNRMALAGLKVVEFSYNAIVHSPHEVAARIRALLERAPPTDGSALGPAVAA